MSDTPRDKYVERVCLKHRERMRKGYVKYGVTCERTDLTLTDWLNHLQEELMDAAVYVERLKDDVDAYDAIDREGD